MKLLIERHAAQIAGVLSCYDRVIAEFAKPLTDAIKANAEKWATANGLTIDYVRKKNFRKEDRIKEVLKKRGTHAGMVWIFSALAPGTT